MICYIQRIFKKSYFYLKEPLFYAQQQESDLKNPPVYLDPNHTHFILVDDGSDDQFGKEIEFRAHLEAELRQGKSLKYYEKKRNQRKKILSRSTSFGTGISGAVVNQNVVTHSDDENDEPDEDNNRNETVPMILIVVQGGPNTLLTVEQSLKQNVPVLVLAVNLCVTNSIFNYYIIEMA